MLETLEDGTIGAWVYKRGLKNKAWKKRWIALRCSTLSYYEHEILQASPLQFASASVAISLTRRRCVGWIGESAST